MADHLGQAHDGELDAALLAACEGHGAGQAPVQLHLQAFADLPLLHGLLAEVPQRALLIYFGSQEPLQHTDECCSAVACVAASDKLCTACLGSHISTQRCQGKSSRARRGQQGKPRQDLLQTGQAGKALRSMERPHGQHGGRGRSRLPAVHQVRKRCHGPPFLRNLADMACLCIHSITALAT